MRANKLVKAELSKLFMRPAIYFMTAFLVIALILISVSYTPKIRENTSINYGTINQTVSDVFSVFNDISSSDKNAKINLDKNLNDAYTNLNTFNTASNLLETIVEKIEKIQTFMTQSSGTAFYNLLIALANNPADNTARQNFINALNTLREDALSVFSFLDTGINNDNIDFYVTQTQLAEIKDFFYTLATIIPREAYLTAYESDELINLGNRISTDYSVSPILEKLEKLNKIKFSQNRVDDIVKKYYTNITYTGTILSTDSETSGSGASSENAKQISVLDVIYTEAVSFVTQNPDSKESDDISALNKILTKYKNASAVGANLLNASFALEKAVGYSDKAINNYIGFSGFNAASYKEQIAFNKYLLNHEIFDGKYLHNMSMSATMGTQASAFDFAFYAMQILSLIITVFCIFFTVSGLAGEQAGGTMKMLAMRPYRKTKIITGKLLAGICFMLMFMLIAAVTSFVVGFSLFGLGSGGSAILVFNSTGAFAVPAFVAFLIYLLTAALNIVFYILIAALLSVILRSTAFATFATFVIYLLGVIFNAIFANSAWYGFLPFAHLDLFKYFGEASLAPQLFAMNSILDGNFLISFAVLFGLILLMDIAAKAIFKKRDIA